MRPRCCQIGHVNLNNLTLYLKYLCLKLHVLRLLIVQILTYQFKKGFPCLK